MHDYIHELAQAVTEVFQTMTSLQVRYTPDLALDSWPPEKQYTAMIGLGGNESGLIYIHFSEAFAVKVTSAMLGTDIGDDKANVTDAVGEIANMVGGSFKNKVAAFASYRLSLPSVIVGKDFETYSPGGSDVQTLQFSCNDSIFLVQLVIKDSLQKFRRQP